MAVPSKGRHKAGSSSLLIFAKPQSSLTPEWGKKKKKNPQQIQFPRWKWEFGKSPGHMTVFIRAYLPNRHGIRNPGANFETVVIN